MSEISTSPRLRLLRPLLRWAMIFCFACAVGVGVFHVVRYRPRCTIPELLRVLHLSPDGARLVTYKPPRRNETDSRGPIQVWDTHNGQVVGEFFHDVPGWFASSPDNKTVAAGLADGTLRLCDWQSGREWQVNDVEHVWSPSKAWTSHFSPRGRWLYVSGADDKPSHVVDVAKGKVVLRVKETVFRFADERLALVNTGANTDVWDLEAVKKVATFDTGPQELITISPDGAAALTHRVLPRPDAPPPTHAVEVWDLKTLARRFRREQTPPGFLYPRFSPDSRSLALWLQAVSRDTDWPGAADFAMVDADTGQLRWSVRVPLSVTGAFSLDSALWFSLQREDDSTDNVRVFDVATGRLRWKKPGRGAQCFIGTNAMLYQVRDELELLDGPTGERLARLNIGTFDNVDDDFLIAANYLELTSDGRHFVLTGRRLRAGPPRFWNAWLATWWPNRFGDRVTELVVVESATGRELFGVTSTAYLRDSLQLSDDVSTLVTAEYRQLRVWDVLATKAWLWAIAAAVATGAGILGLSRWRRKLAERKRQA